MHAVIDSEDMARDLATVAGDWWDAEIGEMYARDYRTGDLDTFDVVTPDGRKFTVTVTEV